MTCAPSPQVSVSAGEAHNCGSVFLSEDDGLDLSPGGIRCGTKCSRSRSGGSRSGCRGGACTGIESGCAASFRGEGWPWPLRRCPLGGTRSRRSNGRRGMRCNRCWKRIGDWTRFSPAVAHCASPGELRAAAIRFPSRSDPRPLPAPAGDLARAAAAERRPSPPCQIVRVAAGAGSGSCSSPVLPGPDGHSH